MKKVYKKLLCLSLCWSILVPLTKTADSIGCIDYDNDNLTDCEESSIYHTNPFVADTDGDGYLDGVEVANNYSPRHNHETKLVDIDSDNDGLNDAWEIILGSDLMNPDTDGDGYEDGLELDQGYSPTSAEPVKGEKKIEVNADLQSLTYYFNNIALDNFLISTGRPNTPTPMGEFTVLAKVPSKDYGGVGLGFYFPDTKWNLHFTTDYWRYYIHGAYWHKNFGQQMSSGCVNVHYDNMERLYNFAEVGTKVLIFDSKTIADLI